MSRLIVIILITLIGCMRTETIECKIIGKRLISSPQSFPNFDKQKLEHFFLCKGQEKYKVI